MMRKCKVGELKQNRKRTKIEVFAVNLAEIGGSMQVASLAYVDGRRGRPCRLF